MKREIPRINKINLTVPAEKALYDAMREVEKLGAGIDPVLTDVIVMLINAQNMLSDRLDTMQSIKDQTPTSSSPPENFEK